jgi:hypothetical protein
MKISIINALSTVLLFNFSIDVVVGNETDCFSITNKDECEREGDGLCKFNKNGFPFTCKPDCKPLSKENCNSVVGCKKKNGKCKNKKVKKCGKLSKDVCETRNDCKFIERNNFSECITNCLNVIGTEKGAVKACKKTNKKTCEFSKNKINNPDCDSVNRFSCKRTEGCILIGEKCVKPQGDCDFKNPKPDECPNKSGAYNSKCDNVSDLVKCSSLDLSEKLCNTDERCFAKVPSDFSPSEVFQCLLINDEGCPGESGFQSDCTLLPGRAPGCYEGPACIDSRGGCCDCDVTQAQCLLYNTDDNRAVKTPGICSDGFCLSNDGNDSGKVCDVDDDCTELKREGFPIWFTGQPDQFNCGNICIQDKCVAENVECPFDCSELSDVECVSNPQCTPVETVGLECISSGSNCGLIEGSCEVSSTLNQVV